MNFDDFKTPGQLIKGLLEDHGWSHGVLAIVLGVDRTVITKLIADKRAIDAGMALSLGEVFQVPPERFLTLQNEYTLAMARVIARPDPGRSRRARLFGDLPIVEMIKRGWLGGVTDARDVPKVEAALMNFFGAQSVEDIEILPHAAKKTVVSTSVTPPQIAWINRVRQIASGMLAARYSPANARSAVASLRELLWAAEEARKVPRILMEAGIRFVIVESLPHAKIDGVCFWLNDFTPVIGMSMRYDRLDNFWFVLRHELEHVIQRHGHDAVMLDTELEGEKAGCGGDVSEDERIANEAAADFCVPAKSLQSFVARKAPIYAERDIIGFSRTLKIHPGLVAGQLQHKTGRYDRFKNHIVKVRSIVAPNAIVDGWGDVAPVE
jgi:HTH-type transcriptional regulator/antitoxin HigA